MVITNDVSITMLDTKFIIDPFSTALNNVKFCLIKRIQTAPINIRINARKKEVLFIKEILCFVLTKGSSNAYIIELSNPKHKAPVIILNALSIGKDLYK